MRDNGNIVIYVDDNGKPQVDVRLQDETVWLTQAQLVDLYQSSKANVSEHIKNIFDEGELDRAATVRKFRTARTEGDRQVERELEYYNLDTCKLSTKQTKEKMLVGYRKYKAKNLSSVEEDYLENIKKTAKRLKGEIK